MKGNGWKHFGRNLKLWMNFVFVFLQMQVTVCLQEGGPKGQTSKTPDQQLKQKRPISTFTSTAKLNYRQLWASVLVSVSGHHMKFIAYRMFNSTTLGEDGIHLKLPPPLQTLIWYLFDFQELFFCLYFHNFGDCLVSKVITTE